MKSAAVAAIGVGATAVVIVGALVQAAGETPAGRAMGMGLSVSVPETYRRLVEQAGNRCPELSPNVLGALLQTESQFDPKAVSPVGAQGIAQFMPSTWETEGIDANHDGKRDVWDPEDAIPSSAAYLCKMAQETRDVPGDKQSNMLAAYNAGSGAVIKAGGVPVNGETEGYVKEINALASKPVTGGGGTITSDQAGTAMMAAAHFIGTPYSWGGGDEKGPSTGSCCSPNGSSGSSTVGFDCSGLVLYAYGRAGIHLPRTAAEQYAATEPVKPEEMRPGDLIFFGSTPEGIHHVGIYIGGSVMIEAPRPGTSVRYGPLDSMPDFYGVGRPIAKKEI